MADQVDPADAAAAVLGAVASGRQIAPFTDADPGFDLGRAGSAALEVLRRRATAGMNLAGHKLGFTNRTIWDEYGVHAPIWGPVYDATVAPIDATPVALDGFLEPKIEPEIVFRLSRAPESGMAPAELIACASHVAFGFEIVQSVFPGWRFRAPDTVAAFALHGALRHGPFREIDPAGRAAWLAALADFRVTLSRGGAVADTGHCSAVLGGGPVVAIGHLAWLLDSLAGAPPVLPGQVFTTGTLTRALPVAPGERWEAEVEGLPLEPVRIAFA